MNSESVGYDDGPFVTVVGIGADGWEGLNPTVRALLTDARILIGSARQLDLLPAEVNAERRQWPTPLKPALADFVRGYAGEEVTVVASGDPMLSGIGTTLVELLGSAQCRVVPAVSSVALARAEMGWSAESTETVTLVGRDEMTLVRYLSPGRRLVVLTSGAASVASVAAMVTDAGFGTSHLTALADLGTAYESRHQGTAENWSHPDLPDLSLLCIECSTSPAAQGFSLVGGLPDEAFDHDGQISKRDIRASALARLAPTPGELLWDVGAGAGSVAIEWSRSDPRCKAIALERDERRAERIRANASRLGVPGLQVILGPAPEVLDGLPTPQAIFIGGGATVAGVMEGCWEALVPGGRLVVHGVTLETERMLMQWYAENGGELIRLSVEKVEPIGSFSGWKPARPVVQWSVRK